MGADPTPDAPFADVIGHGPVLDLLRGEATNPSQAYFFAGPSGTGKATVAIRFAAALVSAGDASVFARALARGHPDVVLVEPDGRSAITVDQARQTIARASLAPLEADRKVFLFEEGGLMNDEAANALLKTLEEPAPSTIFVIVAESVDDLPATVASRCRPFVFGRVEDEVIAEGLVASGVEPEQASRAARIAGGRPGLAVQLATRPEAAAFRAAWLSVAERLPEHPGQAFLLADEVEAAAEPLLAALKDRQAGERESAASQGTVSKTIRDRHDRELRRATSSLFTSGLEILAGFYRDVAAAQLGATVRSPDIPSHSLTIVHPARAVANAERVLETVEALQANQRPRLAFATLFSDLGTAL